MNDARMTIRLPGESLVFAQKYAKELRISLSELVLRYFDRLKECCSANDENEPDSVRDVAGLIRQDIDVEKVYHECLVEKYL